jgi:hypothetical protein
MRLPNRESKNFEDRTMASPFEGMLRVMLDPSVRPGPIQPGDGVPGGYDHWLTHTLSKLTPEDWEDMRQRGMSINDIQMLKNLKKYGPQVLDPNFRKLYLPNGK